MNNIELKEGAVCFAFNHQWMIGDKIGDGNGGVRSVDLDVLKSMVEKPDFQLNTIKQGDYIEASELDTEQKYNDAVEVFGLFGFDRVGEFCLGYADFMAHPNESALICSDGLLMGISKTHSPCKRKVTFNQLMAIGELKRLDIKRDKSTVCGEPKSDFIEAIDKVKELESEDVVNKPSHYQFFEGVEVIEIIASSMTREQFKGYCLGNRIEYRLRAGNKDKLEQEIAKSDKYVELYDEHKNLCKK